MNNFDIKTAVEDVTEIYVFGSIGEDWFGEGNTMETVRESLMDVNTSNIKLNISSFGGSVNDALVIYNLLKVHPATVETNYIGFNASASTIIGSAGDVIKMDNSGSFLVHNAWNVAVGNQHQLRDQADWLEQIDNNIVQNIYKPLTGKRQDSLLNLMKEEKWISADEAKDWGFIHETYEPMKAAASADMVEKIKLSSLPNFKLENKNKMTNENMDTISNSVVDKLKAFFASEKQEVSADELDSKVKQEVKASFDSLDSKIKETASEIEANYQTKLDKADSDFNDLKVENEALQVELETLKMGSAAPASDSDENPLDEKEEVLPANESALEAIKGSLSKLDLQILNSKNKK